MVLMFSKRQYPIKFLSTPTIQLIWKIILRAIGLVVQW
jgi:hypothetical protein